MKTATLAALAVATLATAAHADIFATSSMAAPLKGRTVLTTDACTLPLDAAALGTTAGNIANMRRAFYYLDDGRTEEGCWRYDAETVVLAWPASKVLTRRPVGNFKVADRKSSAWETLR
jgi:hypothetical protein